MVIPGMLQPESLANLQFVNNNFKSSMNMTALETMEDTSGQERMKSRLSLRQNRKRTLNSDISPAPEPRTSHRFRTASTGESEDKSKTSPIVRKLSLGRNVITSSGRRTTAGGSSQSSGIVTSVTDTATIGGRVTGVCPLANLGNTCFLNSVLYALRFLPGFTHDLHHLHMHLQTAGSQSDITLEQRIQFLSELHSVFVNLGKEEKGTSDNKKLPPYHPYDFLEALRVVNPMFEGNRQQDAHELLHCLLDQICHLPQDLREVKPTDTTPENSNSTFQIDHENNISPEPKRRRSERIQALEEDSSKAVDVVGSKFIGRMCLETRCYECEKVTGREENFLEVCVPVKTKADLDEDDHLSESELFMSALCEEECLRDNNKYWCDQCLHHNEARRSVHFSQLPHHLVIHVKRFSSYQRNMFTAKCSEAMPAPLELPCFCRTCLSGQIRRQLFTETKKESIPNIDIKLDNHLPYHLTAVVCHLGATLSSGHYLSFVRLSALHASKCSEQNDQPTSISPQSNISVKNECLWMKCCGLNLEHVHPTTLVNGYSDNISNNLEESMWLECDDDKIKLVTSSEVNDMMRTTSITPYLLFYSRL